MPLKIALLSCGAHPRLQSEDTLTHVRWHERTSAAEFKPEAEYDSILFPGEATLELVSGVA